MICESCEEEKDSVEIRELGMEYCALCDECAPAYEIDHNHYPDRDYDEYDQTDESASGENGDIDVGDV